MFLLAFGILQNPIRPREPPRLPSRWCAHPLILMRQSEKQTRENLEARPGLEPKAARVLDTRACTAAGGEPRAPAAVPRLAQGAQRRSSPGPHPEMPLPHAPLPPLPSPYWDLSPMDRYSSGAVWPPRSDCPSLHHSLLLQTVGWRTVAQPPSGASQAPQTLCACQRLQGGAEPADSIG